MEVVGVETAEKGWGVEDNAGKVGFSTAGAATQLLSDSWTESLVWLNQLRKRRSVLFFRSIVAGDCVCKWVSICV